MFAWSITGLLGTTWSENFRVILFLLPSTRCSLLRFILQPRTFLPVGDRCSGKKAMRKLVRDRRLTLRSQDCNVFLGALFINDFDSSIHQSVHLDLCSILLNLWRCRVTNIQVRWSIFTPVELYEYFRLQVSLTFSFIYFNCVTPRLLDNNEILV